MLYNDDLALDRHAMSTSRLHKQELLLLYMKPDQAEAKDEKRIAPCKRGDEDASSIAKGVNFAPNP